MGRESRVVEIHVDIQEEEEDDDIMESMKGMMVAMQ